MTTRTSQTAVVHISGAVVHSCVFRFVAYSYVHVYRYVPRYTYVYHGIAILVLEYSYSSTYTYQVRVHVYVRTRVRTRVLVPRYCNIAVPLQYLFGSADIIILLLFFGDGESGLSVSTSVADDLYLGILLPMSSS